MLIYARRLELLSLVSYYSRLLYNPSRVYQLCDMRYIFYLLVGNRRSHVLLILRFILVSLFCLEYYRAA
jgi:hypothetical protein